MTKIAGNVVGIPNPRPDWNQTDENKADYIKNKPEIYTKTEINQNFIKSNEDSQVEGKLSMLNGLDVKLTLSTDQLDTSGIDMKTGRIQNMGNPINVTDAATKQYVDSQIASIVDSAPETLNTLNELAAALGDDASFATTIITRLNKIDGQIVDILYEPISILSFSHNMGVQEMGQTVTDVTFSWETNKTPWAIMFDGQIIDNVDTNSIAVSNLSITWNHNKTWTLKVQDERKVICEKSTSITFCNGIYYGVDTVESGFDSAFVTGLTKKLQVGKAYDFTVNPSAQYIYYAVPKRLGTVSFKVGGFEGGFEPPETVSVTNSSNYTEDYYVYRSTNKVTGSITVDVI